MNNYKTLWEFRDACLEDSFEEMHTICSKDSSFIERENPEHLDFRFLAKLYQIQVYSRQGELEKVKSLVEGNPNLVSHSWSAERWTPLHQATTEQALSVFRYLLSKGADPTLCAYAEDISGYTVLHAVAWEGNIGAAQILIERGANVNQKQSNGTSPLHIAKRRKKSEFVKFLISQGAIE